MFLVQGFFELFETLLSYFSNTLSYVRIGAFAVSHAAIMEVVLMLAGAQEGTPNWIVLVIGNIVVCGLEDWSWESRYCVWNIMRCSAAFTRAAEESSNLLTVIKNGNAL